MTEITSLSYLDSLSYLEVLEMFGEACPSSGKPLLKKGMKGEGVKTLQLALEQAGFKPKGGADGNFGTGTYNAVMAFQKAKGLKADGSVGDCTWQALEGTIQMTLNVPKSSVSTKQTVAKPSVSPEQPPSVQPFAPPAKTEGFLSMKVMGLPLPVVAGAAILLAVGIPMLLAKGK